MKRTGDVRSHGSCPWVCCQIPGDDELLVSVQELDPGGRAGSYKDGTQITHQRHCVPVDRKDTGTHCLHHHIQCARPQEKWGRGEFVSVSFKN